MKTKFYLSFLLSLSLMFSACSFSGVAGETIEKKKISALPESENSALYFAEEGTGDPLNRLGDPLLEEVDNVLHGNIWAVMIDNHRGARPYHQGFDEAPIVFEMPAEGGIPRLMAIFSEEQDIDVIGPVRSARDYFLDVAEYFKPVMIHAGGSPEALEILASSYNFLNLDNEYEEDEDFWRDYDAVAPHNLFTSSERVRAFSDDEKWQAAFDQEPFYYSKVFTGEDCSEMEIDFGLIANLVVWTWDEEGQLFTRWQDEEVLDIAVENVVVIISEQWLLEEDEKFRIGVDTTSGGTAFIFRDGQYAEVEWQRADGGRFQFFDDSGKPVGLADGQVFFEFLGSREQVEVVE